MSKKIGRNEPCPCGSGNKFKKCCNLEHTSKSEKFYSNASWTKIPDSQDEHSSFNDAKYVCLRLLDDYGHGLGCEIRGQCKFSWVTDQNGKRYSI